MGQLVRSGRWRCGFPLTGDDTVVDVGCHFGDACVHAGNLGADVIGIDIDAAAVEHTTQRMRQTAARSFQGLVSACDPIPLPDETATAIICTETLEHVDDPRQLLAELARIGKPGARYLITVPDPASESLMKIVAPAWYFQKPIHQRVFERESLREHVRAAGLEPETQVLTDFFGSLWWSFRMTLGMNSPCDPVPRSALLTGWKNTYQALLATPQGARLARQLDQLVPKSQALFARKPGGAAHPALDAFSSADYDEDEAFEQIAAGLAQEERAWTVRIKNWMKDGNLRVGPFRICWNVRRAS